VYPASGGGEARLLCNGDKVAQVPQLDFHQHRSVAEGMDP
jgi:hypothetical protein